MLPPLLPKNNVHLTFPLLLFPCFPSPLQILYLDLLLIWETTVPAFLFIQHARWSLRKHSSDFVVLLPQYIPFLDCVASFLLLNLPVIAFPYSVFQLKHSTCQSMNYNHALLLLYWVPPFTLESFFSHSHCRYSAKLNQEMTISIIE